ncbi:MAG: hypothetical protein J6M66_07565 [Lachnospiraceae bacterium]|nr:hypothetical protein [Lachnospiraceae bacterium]
MEVFNANSISQFRRDMKSTLRQLGIKEKSPHSCRHTFSRLCESYGVREADRKRMLGHSFGNDITNGVCGHRTLEKLRSEIEKIKTE